MKKVHASQWMKVLAGFTVIFFCFDTFVFSVAAHATELGVFETDLDTISRLTHYQGSKEKLVSLLAELADNSGLDLETTAHNEALALSGKISESVYEDRSGGDAVRNRSLVIARHTGDYFWTDSSTMRVHHGHTGIYYNRTQVIEAVGKESLTGPMKPAHMVPYNQVLVAAGAVLREVKTDQGKRNKAAQRAHTYIGRGYNAAFFNPSKDDKGGMHCAQLVWAAYNYGAGIDLDMGIDAIVWPIDLLQTTRAVSYKTL